MDRFHLITLFAVLIAGWSVFVQGAPTESEAVSDSVREPRHLHKKRLCRKYGICDGYGGYQGNQGFGGQHGYGGYPGYPINIAVSQSQSSANEGGGGYTHGNYPNNYQYNGGYPNHGYNQGYNRPDYYGNGYGSYHNQFNGNYYGGNEGGYGLRPHGGFYDESEDGYGDDNERQNDGYAVAESNAETSIKNN